MNKFVKVLFALGLTVLMATPALAEFSVYGSARMSTFYVNAKAPTGATLGVDNKTTSQDLRWTLQDNARLGAKFASGDVSGQVELGLEGNGDGNGVYTRLIYGVYKFDGGNLLLGQTYTPYTFFSEQVFYDDNDNIGFGTLYDSRQPMIKLTLDNGLYLALIQPKTVETNLNEAVETKSFMPKVAVGYDGSFGNVKGGIGFAYNGFTAKNAADDFSKTVSSYLGYLHGVVDLNPVDLSLTAHYGQNLANFGIVGRNYSAAIYDANTNKLEDSSSYGGWFQVGYKMAENVKWDAGVGYTHDHSKAYQDAGLVNAKDVAQATYFINAQVKVAKGFTIVPEFDYFQFIKGYSDGYATDLVKKASGAAFNPKHAWALGAKWQMDF